MISMPYVAENLQSLFVSYCSSVFDPVINSISSTNIRLPSSYPPMDMMLQWSSSVSFMIFSRYILNSVGDKSHPCRTPIDVLEKVPVLLLTQTAQFIFFINIFDYCNNIFYILYTYYVLISYTCFHRMKNIFSI